MKSLTLLIFKSRFVIFKELITTFVTDLNYLLNLESLTLSFESTILAVYDENIINISKAILKLKKL